MRAARLHRVGAPLQLDDVPVPEPGHGEVLVRMAGAGVCHTDVHLRSGEFPIPPGFDLPLTLGHENAGYVEALGAGVEGFARGDAVAVWGGRGCGRCRICRGGDEQVCSMLLWVAAGGYADYMLVPAARFLLPLDGLDPVETAPLADAGLTAYRAVKKALPFLYPGASVVVLGAGGLGHMALKLLRALSPGARVIAVDVADEKLAAARGWGADEVVDGRGDAAARIVDLTSGEGAQAVLDFVGSDASLRTAAGSAGRKSLIVIVGVGGGTLPYSFLAVRAECSVTTSYWGSYTDFEELLALARRGVVRADVERFPLARVNDVLDMLEHGGVHGRAVVVP